MRVVSRAWSHALRLRGMVRSMVFLAKRTLGSACTNHSAVTCTACVSRSDGLLNTVNTDKYNLTHSRVVTMWDGNNVASCVSESRVVFGAELAVASNVTSRLDVCGES